MMLIAYWFLVSLFATPLIAAIMYEGASHES